MDVAALLLTGGASRRMGRDKASLPTAEGTTLAVRTATLLGGVAAVVVEVGPGAAATAHVVVDGRPGAGPLAAVADGAAHLDRLGWRGPVLVVATDLPRLRPSMLAWLAGHRAGGVVVPVVDGRDQLLCARYGWDAVTAAADLVAAGRRRVADLLDGRPVHRAGPEEWSAICSAGDWADVDTPEDLAGTGPVTAPPVGGGGRW